MNPTEVPLSQSCTVAARKPTNTFANTDTHEDTPDRDVKIDHHKNDTVSKAKKGEGEWKPELASNSEQAVKADNHAMSMKEMQEQGAKKAESGKQPSGSSSNPGP